MELRDLEKLLGDMSLEEKVGQMVQIPGNMLTEGGLITGPTDSIEMTKENASLIGSILSKVGAKDLREIQEKFMAEHPHHIPLLFMYDVINGLETIYPIPLAQGCTFSEELVEAAKIAFSHGGKILVEKYINGREIELAALEEETVFVSDPGEIVTDDGFYDFDTKYVNNKAKLCVPAELDSELVIKLKDIAKKVFRTLYCKGIARIDFFVEGSKIYFNEINTLPGFTHISMYPKLMENNGVSYTDLITRLINGASL
jgi:hypothetical protein